MACRGVDLGVLIWKGILCAASTWMPVSFPRWGKLSAISCSKKPSAPFCHSSSSGTRRMWLIFHLTESRRSLVPASWSSHSLPASPVLAVTASSLLCISFTLFHFQRSSWRFLRSLISEAVACLLSSVRGFKRNYASYECHSKDVLTYIVSVSLEPFSGCPFFPEVFLRRILRFRRFG